MKHKERKELLEKGIVSKEVFEALHASANEEEDSRLTIDQTWEFLKKLNLASEMKRDKKPCLYVPSLIPERNEKGIKRAVENMRKSPDSLGFYTSLTKSDTVTDLYSNLLCRLASKEFFCKEKNPGIRFDLSFAAKIENRSVGIVAGTQGSLTWEGEQGSRTTVDFAIVEIDCDNTKKELKFARDKVTKLYFYKKYKLYFVQGICVYLQANESRGSFDHFKSIKIFDDILVSLVHEEDMERFLPCPACLLKGEDRFFCEVGPGFEPHDSMESCQSLIDEESDDQMDEDYRDGEEKHRLDEKQKSLMGSYEQQPVSTLHEFLKDGIQTIEKTPFRELEGDLEIGDQIWIYRDRRTNPCNPVAVMMPYAHVAVYVGVEHGEKKVVHVSICLNGFITATIKKVNLDSVINPEEQGTAYFT